MLIIAVSKVAMFLNAKFPRDIKYILTKIVFVGYIKREERVCRLRPRPKSKKITTRLRIARDQSCFSGSSVTQPNLDEACIYASRDQIDDAIAIQIGDRDAG